MKKNNRSKLPFVLIPLCLIIIFLLTTYRSKSDKSLIVYCSHDSIFAEEVFQRFTEKTGIKVTPRYDTEASKSLGLTEKILREGKNTDCDVYWSNEMFSVAALQEKKLLRPFKANNWQRIPNKFKDDNGFWSGFGARMRVVIFNKDKFPSTTNFKESFLEDDLSAQAIALPLYGTTLTHFALLQKQLGKTQLQALYETWRKKGLQVVAGNGPSRNLVANGNCTYGWTDTDDYFGAVDKGSPVSMLPARLPDGKTIIIPNTVAILESTDRKAAAEVFVDYLLSEENETLLAKSSSRQIPLGKVTEKLPNEVQQLQAFIDEAADLREIFEERTTLLNWLKETHRIK
ncbi:MAG: extracellular solute-binding protein [Lentisphaeraceae bacterium]|nr:extracellular solute-binding protein [Lentisphaeraceae bacterium]